MKVLTRARAVPVWVWFAIVAGGGLGFLVFHRYTQDQADEDWHDPHQPDLQIDVRMSSVPQPSQVRAKSRSYPGSLASWSGCWVGDC